jgi:hypothetical protein
MSVQKKNQEKTFYIKFMGTNVSNLYNSIKTIFIEFKLRILKPLHCLKINCRLTCLTFPGGITGGAPGNTGAQTETVGIKPGKTKTNAGKTSKILQVKSVAQMVIKRKST